MPPCRANARNVNARNGSTTPPILDKKVSSDEFRNAIEMLSQNMNNQNEQVHSHVNKNGGSVA